MKQQEMFGQQPTEMPDLSSYDLIVINSSGGKDSQSMLDMVWSMAMEKGISLDRMVVVHADLGRAEWAGTRELAERQAKLYGIRSIAVSRPQGDLLQRIRARGKWPSPQQRYCTSDLKRGQIARVIRNLCPTGRVLNCIGLRAEESPARAKKPTVSINTKLTVQRRHVDDWLPIHDWTEAEVWANIKASGVPHHPAYDLGMPRLSCVFCIFAPRAALILAGHHNRALLHEYVQMEADMQHTFRVDLSMADIQTAVERGEKACTSISGAWNM